MKSRPNKKIKTFLKDVGMLFSAGILGFASAIGAVMYVGFKEIDIFSGDINGVKIEYSENYFFGYLQSTKMTISEEGKTTILEDYLERGSAPLLSITSGYFYLSDVDRLSYISPTGSMHYDHLELENLGKDLKNVSPEDRQKLFSEMINGALFLSRETDTYGYYREKIRERLDAYE